MYASQNLNDDEKVFFELIMTALNLNNADKSEMRDHIDTYLLPFENRKLVDILKKKMSVPNSQPQKDEIKEGFEKIDLLIKEQIANTEEDFYSGYECDGMKWINSIISGDIDFYYTEDSKQSFIDFLCIQYFRTIEMRNAVKENIINMKAEVGDKEPGELVLYYPLSPKIAIIVNGSDSQREKQTDNKMQVDELNHIILEHSYVYVVGNNQGVLEGLIDMYL